VLRRTCRLAACSNVRPVSGLHMLGSPPASKYSRTASTFPSLTAWYTVVACSLSTVSMKNELCCCAAAAPCFVGIRKTRKKRNATAPQKAKTIYPRQSQPSLAGTLGQLVQVGLFRGASTKLIPTQLSSNTTEKVVTFHNPNEGIMADALPDDPVARAKAVMIMASRCSRWNRCRLSQRILLARLPCFFVFFFPKTKSTSFVGARR